MIISYRKIVVIAFVSFSIAASCRKDQTQTDDCFNNIATTRHIVNKQATVVLAGTEIYLVEQGTIDTRLYPCNLDTAFRVNNLPVKISGEVKGTSINGIAPCCGENFVITKISR
jgi:hypothetical protein